jgi:FkbM family methyltransferase
VAIQGDDMKRIAARLANRLLRPFGAQIVSTGNQQYLEQFRLQFSMRSAIERTRRRDFEVNTIVDIGASDGRWSVEARHHHPNCTYLAIEPLDERREELEGLRQQLPNFNYVLCAVGEQDGGHVILNVTEDLDGSTVGGKNPGVPRKVPVRTLDSLILERALRGPFMLKFDTHGFEIPILSGATDTLKETSIVIIEVYNFGITDTCLRFHQTCSYMESLGFRCFDLADPLLRPYDESFWQMDLFFCREDSPLFAYPHYA